MFSLQSRCVVAVALCGAVVGADCRADTSAQKSGRRDIAATYQRVAKALMHKDLAPMAAALSPDYECFSTLGTLNREQSVAVTRQFFASVKSISKIENKILSLTWRGPDAVVIVQNTTVAIAQKGGKTVRLEAVNTSRDYWSRTNGGWQIRQNVDRGAKMWMNGRRVQ